MGINFPINYMFSKTPIAECFFQKFKETLRKKLEKGESVVIGYHATSRDIDPMIVRLNNELIAEKLKGKIIIHIQGGKGNSYYYPNVGIDLMEHAIWSRSNIDIELASYKNKVPSENITPMLADPLICTVWVYNQLETTSCNHQKLELKSYPLNRSAFPPNSITCKYGETPEEIKLLLKPEPENKNFIEYKP